MLLYEQVQYPWEGMLVLVQGMRRPPDRSRPQTVRSRYWVENGRVRTNLMLTLSRLRSDSTADGRLMA